LVLPFGKTVQNHLSGVHAAAQYLLAESAGGYYLLTAFPNLQGKIMPLLRKSTIEFNQQAYGDLSSSIVVSDEAVSKFLSSMEKRGRAVLDVVVDIADERGNVTCRGSFRWFVQVAEG
jgi:acyl-coenzyme A thioesterase PaaI-like protein